VGRKKRKTEKARLDEAIVSKNKENESVREMTESDNDDRPGITSYTAEK
jgi:hypothetical protein